MVPSPEIATPLTQQVFERIRRTGESLTPHLDDMNRRRYPSLPARITAVARQWLADDDESELIHER